MDINVERASGGEPKTVTGRIEMVSDDVKLLCARYPDAARIEIDIEWPDGGRVKVEGKA